MKTNYTKAPPKKPETFRDPRFENLGLYDRYRVAIRATDKICGGVPKNPDIILSFVKAQTGFDDELTAEQAAILAQKMAAGKAPTTPANPIEAMAEKIDASWNGFPYEPGVGLYIQAHQIKAMMREGFTMLRIFVEKVGGKQIFQHGMEVKGHVVGHEDKIFFQRPNGDGVLEYLTEPDGNLDGPIHVVGPQGPRSALKRVDFTQYTELHFDVWIMRTAATEKRHLGEKELIEVLTFCQEDGLGADRSQGQGKFSVTAFEKLVGEARKTAPAGESPRFPPTKAVPASGSGASGKKAAE